MRHQFITIGHDFHSLSVACNVPTCGKKSYPTFKKALRAAAFIVANGESRAPKRLRAYHCSTCGAYHIGHRFGRNN